MIVSIYLKEHEYLINSPQTFNFGGKYLYSFNEINNELCIKRKINEKYIPNFFNISQSECKIELLSAIVGENGVGKSSILDLIRSIFSNQYSPYGQYVVLVEENGETKVLYSNIGLNIYLEGQEIKRANKENYQSIYYSPHFDLKYNPNFDKYDISLDQYIKQDLEDTENKDTNENGFKYPLHEELKFKNSLRQIEFLNSSIFNSHNIFKNTFNLPNYKYGVLYFRETAIDYDTEGKIDFCDTPTPLLPIIELILDKIKEENKDWSNIRDQNLHIDDKSRQAIINKYLLERFVIKCFMTMVIDQMEKSNVFLYEGMIPELNTLDEKSALEVFKYFIKESYIENYNYKRQIFNSEDVFSFFEKLFSLFEKEVNPSNISKQSIHLKLDDLKEILEQHKKIITNLFKYYPTFEGQIEKNNYVEGILSFRPTDRNMSSGETAMLNFMSILYHFIDMNLVEERKSLHNKQNYILLLDEADLGFHPIWKKKYVKAILEILPYFFENLNMKPNLQIIITTHDPLTLSDLPINNVVFLQKQNDFCEIVSEIDKIQKTFGANITDLLAHSFFVADGLIGDFAKSKISEIIDWINENKTNRGKNFEEKLKHYKKVINLIDEQVLRLKLTEMITKLVPDDTYYNQAIDEEISKLNRLKK